MHTGLRGLLLRGVSAAKSSATSCSFSSTGSFSSSGSSFSSSSSDVLRACLQETRAVLQVQGQQVVTFLQGLVTNDLRPLEHTGRACCNSSTACAHAAC